MPASGVRRSLHGGLEASAAEAVLAATGLGGSFPVVVGADCCDRRKPDPEHVRHTLARLSGVAQDAPMVGDRLADVRAAYEAGVACLLHMTGYGEVPGAEPGVTERFDSSLELLESMH